MKIIWLRRTRPDTRELGPQRFNLSCPSSCSRRHRQMHQPQSGRRPACCCRGVSHTSVNLCAIGGRCRGGARGGISIVTSIVLVVVPLMNGGGGLLSLSSLQRCKRCCHCRRRHHPRRRLTAPIRIAAAPVPPQPQSGRCLARCCPGISPASVNLCAIGGGCRGGARGGISIAASIVLVAIPSMIGGGGLLSSSSLQRCKRHCHCHRHHHPRCHLTAPVRIAAAPVPLVLTVGGRMGGGWQFADTDEPVEGCLPHRPPPPPPRRHRPHPSPSSRTRPSPARTTCTGMTPSGRLPQPFPPCPPSRCHRHRYRPGHHHPCPSPSSRTGPSPARTICTGMTPSGRRP